MAYSVMQSDGNSFSGGVVLDSFNMVYGDEVSTYVRPKIRFKKIKF